MQKLSNAEDKLTRSELVIEKLVIEIGPNTFSILTGVE